MATRINAGSVKRTDLYQIDPSEIYVKEELRGRHVPPSEEHIVFIATSMMDHGQMENVECRRIENNRLQLTMGFTRMAAARLIQHGFTDAQGTKRRDENFRITVRIVDADEGEAFIRNVVENCHRHATSPIDDAFNQQSLREKHQYTDKQIAQLYGYRDSSNVSRLRKLLTLTPKQQEMIHIGKLSVTAAVDLIDLPEEKQNKVLAEAVKKNGKVDTNKVRNQVREHHLADREAPAAPPSGSVASKSNNRNLTRSMRDMRNFFTKLRDETEQDNVRQFAREMLAFIMGRKSEKAMTSFICGAV